MNSLGMEGFSFARMHSNAVYEIPDYRYQHIWSVKVQSVTYLWEVAV